MSNTKSRLALSVLALTSVSPLGILGALAFVAASIESSFAGGSDNYLLSLRMLVAILLLWVVSPAVAAIVAKRAGLLTSRAIGYWLLVWGGTTTLVLIVLSYWQRAG